MLIFIYRLGAAVLALLFASAFAHASDRTEIWGTRITRVWLNDNVAVAQRPSRIRHAYRLSRTEIWANGIVQSEMPAFAPGHAGRSLGAKLQPFDNVNFRLGTELVRGGGDAHLLSSNASWEAFLSRSWEDFGGLKVDLSTAGFMGIGYSQSVSGTLGIPLDEPHDSWRTELRFSPNISLDTLNRSISTGLISELMTEAVLSSQRDEFRSVLNLTLGYGVAPNARPTASARLELRISPNL